MKRTCVSEKAALWELHHCYTFERLRHRYQWSIVIVWRSNLIYRKRKSLVSGETWIFYRDRNYQPRVDSGRRHTNTCRTIAKSHLSSNSKQRTRDIYRSRR